MNYFLGLVLCKVFSAELLNAPWLLHLDVFRSRLGAVTRLGRSRPDLFGQDPSSGAWHSFECKGRASAPSSEEKRKAKLQAQRLISVGGTRCTYHIGSFTFFQGDTLRFYWRDPPAKGRLEVPEPGEEWGAYYRPFVALWRSSRERGIRAEGKFPVDRDEDLDISLSIHPEVEGLLAQGNWAEARKVAIEMGASLKKDGYRPDGLAVRVGDSWSRTPRRRLKS